ncbi:MAG: anhydro-N-acetylmuramic acid kinase, partial [Thermoflexales bacterium]|nr:anhydro-N-acetylmuramic acid kinase [Thermoflexales bacterium]
MSGTSADGIDAALVELRGVPPHLTWRLIQHTFMPYPPEVRAEILACFRPEQGSVDRICLLNATLGELFAEAALQCIRDAQLTTEKVDLIGCHGQTVWHVPGRATLQLGEASVIAERTGLPVVSNFRARDIAAGGQGAPLVAYVDALLLSHPKFTRTALNIGGIANFTYLPPLGSSDKPFAFDTGPGNVLIDDAVQRLTRGALAFDRDGAIAASAEPNQDLLNMLLQHPYFSARPPKTTGRELFGADFGERLWIESQRLGVSGESLVATLTLLTARTIADAHRMFLPRPPDQVLVSGGGSRNLTLMRWLTELLKPAEVLLTDAIGMPSAAKEAIAFAVLAYETWHGRTNNLPDATGAHHAVVLGQITPASGVLKSSYANWEQVTEAINPASERIDCLPTLALVDVINAEDRKVALSVASQREVIARAIDAIAERMRLGGR